MALAVTTRTLTVSQNRATRGSSEARLWVYDRRLELLTRAFTLWGHVWPSYREPTVRANVWL
jgi:transposase